MNRPSLPRSLVGAALALQMSALHAQERGADATTLDSVQVLGARRALSDFPGAVSVIDGDTLRSGQRQVSLAETLVRVPGIGVLDRQNYAQDLQIQSRGFGSRSTFGIRGIALIVDGIPSSALDGQGRRRISARLARPHRSAARAAGLAVRQRGRRRDRRRDGARWAQRRERRRLGRQLRQPPRASRHRAGRAARPWRWQALGSHFVTDGERPHSAAERAQLDAVAQWSPDADRRLRVVLGGLSQPETDDPLGLTRAQWQREPHGTDPAALLFDTRKSIDNAQAGMRWDDAYAPGRAYWLGGYGIDRDVVQFLAVPVVAQRAPSSAGGVIDLGRRSAGAEAGHRWEFARGALAMGVEAGRLKENRRGYENFVDDGLGNVQLGVRGRLRRDEDNRVDDREAFVSGDLRLADHWNALAAVRHARIDFESRDHYIAPGNGDDSGRIDYSETAASVGVASGICEWRNLRQPGAWLRDADGDGAVVPARWQRGLQRPERGELRHGRARRAMAA